MRFGFSTLGSASMYRWGQRLEITVEWRLASYGHGVNRSCLDHLVFGGPDLDMAVTRIREMTGLTPVRGGRHLGEGTANCLLGLGAGAYLEIIGPDPDAPAPAGPRWFGLDDLSGPRLITWALRPDDLDARVVTARAAGYDPGVVRSMSRRRDDGTALSWRLTPDTVAASGGVVPFLIDWGSTTHPSAGGLPSVELVSLGATAQPDTTKSMDALGARLSITPGAHVGLRAVLITPHGRVTLT